VQKHLTLSVFSYTISQGGAAWPRQIVDPLEDTEMRILKLERLAARNYPHKASVRYASLLLKKRIKPDILHCIILTGLMRNCFMQVDLGAALVNIFLTLIPLVMIIGLFCYVITSMRNRFK
jgi:hypothetical protein